MLSCKGCCVLAKSYNSQFINGHACGVDVRGSSHLRQTNTKSFKDLSYNKLFIEMNIHISIIFDNFPHTRNPNIHFSYHMYTYRKFCNFEIKQEYKIKFHKVTKTLRKDMAEYIASESPILWVLYIDDPQTCIHTYMGIPKRPFYQIRTPVHSTRNTDNLKLTYPQTEYTRLYSWYTILVQLSAFGCASAVMSLGGP